MTDDALRKLERSLSAVDSAETRLRLAQEYSRAGRTADALGALRLAGLSDESFQEAKPLADALWHDALSRIQPDCDVALTLTPESHSPRKSFDPTGSTLVLGLGWNGGGVAFVDVATGRVLHHRPELHALDFYPCAGGGFVYDHATAALEKISRVGDQLRFERRARPESLLLSVSPTGEQLCLLENGARHVVGWPDFDSVFESQHQVQVDWESGLVVERGGEGARVRRLDGEGEPWTLPDGRRPRRLAPGVFTDRGEGRSLWLHGVHPERWSLALVPHSARDLAGPSLSSDRRGVRLLLGGRPLRLEVDLLRGALRPTSPSYNLAALARKRTSASAPLFHPHADVVALCKKRRYRLRAFDGRHVLTFPEGVTPSLWSPDGFTLLALSEGRISLWRVPRG